MGKFDHLYQLTKPDLTADEGIAKIVEILTSFSDHVWGPGQVTWKTVGPGKLEPGTDERFYKDHVVNSAMSTIGARYTVTNKDGYSRLVQVTLVVRRPAVVLEIDEEHQLVPGDALERIYDRVGLAFKNSVP